MNPYQLNSAQPQPTAVPYQHQLQPQPGSNGQVPQGYPAQQAPQPQVVYTPYGYAYQQPQQPQPQMAPPRQQPQPQAQPQPPVQDPSRYAYARPATQPIGERVPLPGTPARKPARKVAEYASLSGETYRLAMPENLSQPSPGWIAWRIGACLTALAEIAKGGGSREVNEVLRAFEIEMHDVSRELTNGAENNKVIYSFRDAESYPLRSASDLYEDAQSILNQAQDLESPNVDDDWGL